MTTLKKSPLDDFYKGKEVKKVDFGGWDLPVQFSSIKEEHEAVRAKAGLFDVSHMGEVEVSGEGALDFLQRLVTNDVRKMVDGKAQYTAMCNELGGTLDDLLIYRKNENNYLLVTNAANTEKDVQWMKKHAGSHVTVTDASDRFALIAIQGPKAEHVLQKVTAYDLASIRFFQFVEEVDIAEVRTLVSRTGYTGEDGFELYCDKEDAKELWSALLKVGKEHGLIACGLGTRDLLRFEATLPLYGQELTEEISPLEAGIGFAVKTETDFIGKEALKKQKEDGVSRKIVGLEMLERGIPRTGYDVYANDEKIGVVTSGTQSLSLKKNVGLALLNIDYTKLETIVEVQVRKKRLKAKVVETPFYKRG